jgi:hypothetical protein
VVNWKDVKEESWAVARRTEKLICGEYPRSITFKDLKVGYLHPVACTRSGSGFPSNATLV